MTAKTIDEFLAHLSADKRAALEKLRKTIRAALPKAEECISYVFLRSDWTESSLWPTAPVQSTARSIQALIPLKSIKTNSRHIAPAKGPSVLWQTVHCQSLWFESW